MRLLLIGFGGVGQELARILSSRAYVDSIPEHSFTITGITTASRGSMYCRNGLNLVTVLEDISKNGCFSETDPNYTDADSAALISQSDFDILVELSTLSIENQGQPAAGYIESALKIGRHCVSANKGPLAFHFRKLTELASSKNKHFLFESTVMDGAPIFNLSRHCLRGCRVEKIEGVLNATSNFVLSEMEKGISQAESIRVAQLAGFAEADPSHDIEGWDSAAKIAVLANVLMGQDTTPLEVRRNGISKVTTDQVRRVLDKGKRLKLIAKAETFRGRLDASVELREIGVDEALARVPSRGSILRIHTDLMGPIVLQQDAPTLSDTAYGVLNDLLEIRDNTLDRNDLLTSDGFSRGVD
jgi:homoserine dehydrogenase